MRKRWTVMVALFLLAGAMAAQQPQPGLEKLKTLVGEWEGTNGQGKQAGVSYRLLSGGTALEEVLDEKTENHNMITVYHVDGNRLLMTHYCAANNQPRMQGQSTPDGKLVFRFVGATNLASPSAGHMHGLVVTFVDRDHFTQEWAWHENGEVKKEVFRFTRKQ